MSIIALLLILIVAGFILFLFNRFVPLEGSIKSLINYVVVFLLVMVVILFFLDLFGLYSNPIRLK